MSLFSQVGTGIEPIHTLPLYYTPRDCTITSSDKHGKYMLAIGGSNGVELYSLKIDQSADVSERVTVGGPMLLHECLAISSVVFSPSGSHLAVAALDGHLGIWSFSHGHEKMELWFMHTGSVRLTSLSFSSDGNFAAVGFWDETCWLLEKKTRENGTDGSHDWAITHRLGRTAGEEESKISAAFPGALTAFVDGPGGLCLVISQAVQSRLLIFHQSTAATHVVYFPVVVKGLALKIKHDVPQMVYFARGGLFGVIPTDAICGPVLPASTNEEEGDQVPLAESKYGKVFVLPPHSTDFSLVLECHWGNEPIPVHLPFLDASEFENQWHPGTVFIGDRRLAVCFKSVLYAFEPPSHWSAAVARSPFIGCCILNDGVFALTSTNDLLSWTLRTHDSGIRLALEAREQTSINPYASLVSLSPVSESTLLLASVADNICQLQKCNISDHGELQLEESKSVKLDTTGLLDGAILGCEDGRLSLEDYATDRVVVIDIDTCSIVQSNG